MHVQLTLEGGLYGRLELAPLELDLSNRDQVDAGLSVQIAKALEPGFLAAAAGADEEDTGNSLEGHTDAETFLLSVTRNRAEDGGHETYRLSRKAIDSFPELKTLVDFLWRRTKPLTASEAS